MTDPGWAPPGDSKLLPEPPSLPEAEVGLLACVLTKGEWAHLVADKVEAHQFSEAAYGALWEVVLQLVARDAPITIPTLLEPAAAHLGWEKAETGQFLVALLKRAVSPSAKQARHYADMIRDVWIRRQVFEAADEMKLAARKGAMGQSGAQILEDVESRLFTIGAQAASDERSYDFAQAISSALDQAHVASEQREAGKLIGVTCGVDSIDKKLGGLRKTDVVILAGATGMGKAQPLDAKILMADGSFKPMGDIRVGDRLASVDGRPSEVSGVFPQGRMAIFSVTFGDGRSTKACADHLWEINKWRWDSARIVTTTELGRLIESSHNRMRLWVQQVAGDFGHQAALPIDPWVLGALIGDGGLKEMTPKFSSADPELIERMRRLVGPDMELRHGGKFDYRLVMSKRNNANRLGDALVALGLNLGSEHKFLPEQYLTADRAARLALLQGLMDTDGWAEKYGSVRYCTVSLQLALDVQRLARSLGAMCKIKSRFPKYTYRGEKKTGRLAYTCKIRHEFPAQFFTLRRKVQRARNQMAPRLNVASVVPCGEADAQCISVTHPSRLYVTDDYVVTHNTAAALKITKAAAQQFKAENPDKPEWVHFFSMEMSADQLAMRSAAGQARINFEKIRLGNTSPTDLMALEDAGRELQDLPIQIDDSSNLSVAAIRTRARRLKRKKGLGLIVIDYLQLIGTSREEAKESRGNRVQEIGLIMRALKALAKDLDVPVLVLCQLSRKLEEREDKRPQLSDLRESGEIEMTADVVSFVYREAYYLQRRPPAKREKEKELDFSLRRSEWGSALEQAKDKIEFIIGKNRHGSCATLLARFVAELMLLEDDTPGDATQTDARKEQLRMNLMSAD